MTDFISEFHEGKMTLAEAFAGAWEKTHSPGVILCSFSQGAERVGRGMTVDQFLYLA